jgi:hypothetical protein
MRAMLLPIVTLAIWVGIFLGTAVSGEVPRPTAWRLILDLPEGGLTQLSPPESVSTWSHSAAGLTLKAEVAGVGAYEHWQRAFTALQDYPANAGAYRIGTLPRSDRYLQYTVSMTEKYGLPKRDGKWTQSHLVFSSSTLAARITVEGPTLRMRALDTDLERFFASARLIDAKVEDRAHTDPRIELDLLEGFVQSELPTRTFRFKHERLPLTFILTLSDPKTYESWESSIRISARRWKPGNLARSDNYLYYSVQDAYPEFEVAFREWGETVEVDVSIENGGFRVEEIERILASARIMPAADMKKD